MADGDRAAAQVQPAAIHLPHRLRPSQLLPRPGVGLEGLDVGEDLGRESLVHLDDGDVGGGYLGWHKDLVYVQHINHGGILRALKASKVGGRTGFIDQIDAYDRLPEDLKQQIEGLHVVYRLGSFDDMKYMTRASFRVVQTAASAKSVIESVEKHFPPVSHPLVFVQPETGRKVLNLSPFFAMYIEELGAEGGHELLTRLAHHVLDSPAYHHAWTTGEMILWDNWRMLHSVSPAPVTEERVMQRTTIKGDYGAGRTLPFPVAA